MALGNTGRIVLIVVSVPVALVIILGVVLLLASPGSPRAFLDKEGRAIAGSISEKPFVDVNGVRQGMFIRGRDVNNPVVLFLHGGCGMPEYFLDREYPSGLEQYLTVAWWDRRGAGLSNTPDVSPESINVEQFISDTVAVTNYLRARFHKDKILLMAHSGGSITGIQAAARYPELFQAYIGVGQMSYQLKSENVSWAYMVDLARKAGNTKLVRQLEGAEPSMSVPLPAAYMKLRDTAMHSLGVGTTRDMKSVITGVFLASWFSPEYTLGEKLALWKGKFASDRLLWNKLLGTDLTRSVTSLDLPVYFFSGIHDYTVAYPEAKAYFEELKAPVKGFYTFQDSAHSPMFEEPARVKEIILTDVLPGKNSMADGI